MSEDRSRAVVPAALSEMSVTSRLAERTLEQRAGRSTTRAPGERTLDDQELLPLDVTPLSIGIEGPRGVLLRLIDRGTRLPTTTSRLFSTTFDKQGQIEIHLLQGERKLAADNKTLGRFILDGIPPAPRGIPQIEVTFDIDANGILDIKALDRATGKEQDVRITASSMLDKSAIDQMVRDAQEHAEEKRDA